MLPCCTVFHISSILAAFRADLELPAGDGVPPFFRATAPPARRGFLHGAFPNLDGVFLGQKPCALGGGFVVQAIK